MSAPDLTLSAVARNAWNATKAARNAERLTLRHTQEAAQFDAGCQVLARLLPQILGVKVDTAQFPPAELAHDFIPVRPDDADYDTRRPEGMRPGLTVDAGAFRPLRLTPDFLTATVMLDDMDYRPQAMRDGRMMPPEEVQSLEVRVIGHREDRYVAFKTLSDLGAALESHEQEDPSIFDDRNKA